jgi:hypothetical protein
VAISDSALVVEALGARRGLSRERLDGDLVPHVLDAMNLIGSGSGSEPELQDGALSLWRALPGNCIERANARHLEDSALRIGVVERPWFIGRGDEYESFCEASEPSSLHYVYAIKAIGRDGRELNFAEATEIHGASHHGPCGIVRDPVPREPGKYRESDCEQY